MKNRKLIFLSKWVGTIGDNKNDIKHNNSSFEKNDSVQINLTII